MLKANTSITGGNAYERLNSLRYVFERVWAYRNLLNINF